MKTTKLLLRFTIFLLFSAIILGRIQIGTYGIFHFLLVFLLILIFLFPDNIVLSKFFQLDSISIYILFFLLVVTLSYLINYSNSEHVAKTYSSNTGESPKFLYGKIAVIGLVNVIAAFLAYNLGKIFSYKTKNLFVLYDSLFFLFAITCIKS